MVFLPPNVWLVATEAAESAPDPSLILGSVLMSLVIIYLASKLGGELSNRLNLPPVLGELVGGVLIGVSVFHLIVFPEGGTTVDQSQLINFMNWVSPMSPETAQALYTTQSEVISTLAELGVVILLFEIGLESELEELLRVGPQAAIVAIVGVIAPFSLGTAGLTYFFGVPAIPAVFAGAALTATSIGITAKVLAELKKISTKEGQIIIGAAVLDDILGIIVLAVVASLAKTGEIQVTNIIWLVIGAGGFMVATILFGRAIKGVITGLMAQMETRGKFLAVSLIFAFILAFIAANIQLEAILGSFAAGLVLAETDDRHEIQKELLPVADFFVPIFFVCVGAKTDLSVLNPAIPSNREGLIIAAFLVVVAIFGKLVTGFTLFGSKDINKVAIGVGMIPRGEVGLVFAGVGAASGALSESTEAAIIMMVIITTFVAPPLLRVAFQKFQPPAAVETKTT